MNLNYLITKEQMVELGIAIAFLRFIKNDRHLLTVDASERSMKHRLAVYLEQEFPDYHVDCEYNRDGLDKKMINPWRSKIENLERERDNENTTDERKWEIQDIIDGGKVSVYPDIIIHHCGTSDNFIVIEAKKQSSKVSGKIDCDKLKSFIQKLKYKYAYHIIFPDGEHLNEFNIRNWDNYINPVKLENQNPTDQTFESSELSSIY